LTASERAGSIGFVGGVNYISRMDSVSSPSSPVIRPRDEKEIAAILRDRAGSGGAIVVRGGGSKAGFGKPVESRETMLDMGALSGILLYEPDELVLTARAGTPMSEITQVVAQRQQYLAFEPPEFGALLGSPGCSSTLGGTVASGWSGPRRIKAGAVRDHVLGMRAVGGDGEVFKSGGRVVKNVTGFDLPKLLTGSHGTLAVMTEITIKVMPAPEQVLTIAIPGLDAGDAIQSLGGLLGGPFEISGAAHLPAAAVTRSRSVGLAEAGVSATLIRLEGFGPSVMARSAAVERFFGGRFPIRVLDQMESQTIWAEIRDVATLLDPDRIVWRLSLPPSSAAATVAKIAQSAPVEVFYDWGGGLIWLALPFKSGGHAALIRGLLPAGHATLIRAPEALRATVPIFQPSPRPLAALASRVKSAFDPRGILAPGRSQAEC
jgi:glycolate oxidase FAD binding subunit